MLAAVNDGTGSPGPGAEPPSLEPLPSWLPRLVKSPTQSTSTRPMPVPMRMKRLSGLPRGAAGGEEGAAGEAPGPGSGAPGGAGTAEDMAGDDASECGW